MTEHLPRGLADGLRTAGVGNLEVRQHLPRPRWHQQPRSPSSGAVTPNCAAPASAIPAKVRTPSSADTTMGLTAVSETAAALPRRMAGAIGRALALQVSAPRPYAARCPGNMRTLPKACPHRAAANPAPPIRAAAVGERPTRYPGKRPNHTSQDRDLVAFGAREAWAGCDVVIAVETKRRKSKVPVGGRVWVGVGP